MKYVKNAIIMILFITTSNAQTMVSLTAQPDGGTSQPTAGKFATGWVARDFNSRTSDDITALGQSSAALSAYGNGWARFDLSTSGIPMNAIITNVTVSFDATGVYSQLNWTFRGYSTISGSTNPAIPDPIKLPPAVSDADLFNAIYNAAAWSASGTSLGNIPQTTPLNAVAVTTIQDYFNGSLNNPIIIIGVRWATNIVATSSISGYTASSTNDRPKLNITYVTSTSIQNNYSTEKLSIYPNPSGDKINIEPSIFGMEKISLFNVLGKNVLNFFPAIENQPNKIQIDISNIPSGIYWMIVNTKNGNYIKRLVKK